MNNLATKYAGKTETPDANYPTGGFKNETTPGLFDGTPFEKGWADDLNAFMQGLLKAANITASGTTDTVLVSQILQGVLYQAQTADYFIDSGAADAYVLAPLTNNYAPVAYKDGQNIRFIPDNANTGATTVNVSALGAKAIKLQGVALVAGDLVAGETYSMRYDLALGWFELTGTSEIKDGSTVQVVNAQDGEVATGTTVMTFADTIPVNTEGDEYITLAITPKSTTNKLRIEVIASAANTGTGKMSMALFQDSTANALAATSEFSSNANTVEGLSLNHYMVAGTTSPITFKIRIGRDGAGTTTFNGISGGRIFGGVMSSSITITEIKA